MVKYKNNKQEYITIFYKNVHLYFNNVSKYITILTKSAVKSTIYTLIKV